jgi:hypothetical protein
MDTSQNQKDISKVRLAQPAAEEIKLHGDQLAKEVKAAAGGKREEESMDQDETTSGKKSS